MTSRLKFADRLALVVLLLAAIAAIAGLLVQGLYRDTAEGIRQARATDLVTILVAAPALTIGLWRARAGRSEDDWWPSPLSAISPTHTPSTRSRS
jgi:hypothetical protein